MIDRLRQNRARPRGFSLVEVAVVLVIIGLILAAVLQGRQLIASAEYKSLRSQLSEHRNAFYTFRDRYNALPGDFADASDRLGIDGGNGNGVIGTDETCDGDSDESCLAWQHLRAADMLDGNPDDSGSDASPRHTYGGVVESFFTGTAGNGSYGHKLNVADLPADVAIRLDGDMDDELCDSGRVAAIDGDDCDGTDWSPASDRIAVMYGL